jgi:hypothetical protein
MFMKGAYLIQVAHHSRAQDKLSDAAIFFSLKRVRSCSEGTSEERVRVRVTSRPESTLLITEVRNANFRKARSICASRHQTNQKHRSILLLCLSEQ